LVASAHDRDFVVHGKYLFERAKDLLKRANRTPEASRNCEAVLFERRGAGIALSPVRRLVVPRQLFVRRSHSVNSHGSSTDE
jgi:hypothetical protein